MTGSPQPGKGQAGPVMKDSGLVAFFFCPRVSVNLGGQ